MTTGDINEGGDWASGLTITNESDAFTWDCDGLGIGLNRQFNDAFEGKKMLIKQYKGSEAVDFPEAVYYPADRVMVHNQ